MAQIQFKATRKNSLSASGYRQIEKSGDLSFDDAADSDDVILLRLQDKGGGKVIIDCDKATGVFSIKFPDGVFELSND